MNETDLLSLAHEANCIILAKEPAYQKQNTVDNIKPRDYGVAIVETCYKGNFKPGQRISLAIPPIYSRTYYDFRTGRRYPLETKRSVFFLIPANNFPGAFEPVPLGIKHERQKDVLGYYTYPTCPSNACHPETYELIIQRNEFASTGNVGSPYTLLSLEAEIKHAVKLSQEYDQIAQVSNPAARNHKLLDFMHRAVTRRPNVLLYDAASHIISSKHLPDIFEALALFYKDSNEKELWLASSLDNGKGLDLCICKLQSVDTATRRIAAWAMSAMRIWPQIRTEEGESKLNMRLQKLVHAYRKEKDNMTREIIAEIIGKNQGLAAYRVLTGDNLGLAARIECQGKSVPSGERVPLNFWYYEECEYTIVKPRVVASNLVTKVTYTTHLGETGSWCRDKFRVENGQQYGFFVDFKPPLPQGQYKIKLEGEINGQKWQSSAGELNVVLQ